MGDVPAGRAAVILLSVEALAVNDLRETFHHWVRPVAVAFPVKNEKLGAPLPHAAAAVPARAPTGTEDGYAEHGARD